MTQTPAGATDSTLVHSVDEPVAPNQRDLIGWQGWLLYWCAAAYAVFHLLVLNVFPLETWTFRMIHVGGGLMIGFALAAALSHTPGDERPRGMLEWLLAAAGGVLAAFALGAVISAWIMRFGLGTQPPAWLFGNYGIPLLAASVIGIVGAVLYRGRPSGIHWADWILIACSAAVAAYLVFNVGALQFRAGVMPTAPDYWTALAGLLLILEVTRRLAGLPLVLIAVIFIIYGFIGPYLPGILQHSGYAPARFFTYLYTDNGILGPTIAVSSTYIILFITFAAFLQASKVGDYFVNFAFAAAGQARGGPAKVAVFASGLMGMINGTSAGNVVATGSLTIPLMKKVGYSARSAGAIEAAASTGGQIMPPIMGAGAFIMAEVTGIPYTEIIVAATIPAILYFASIYFMVHLEALRMDMRGMRREDLPQFKALAKQVYLFVPIIILIGAMFLGYSVIRAGTLALVAAVVVSWLTPYRMGIRSIIGALDLSTRLAVQLIAVCACAGIIVGVIGLTGVGLRFSSLLLGVAESSQLLALIFAMGISILLGMGMPTTAAYAVAASVVAPGLIKIGLTPLVAHFFVFYFAVISAITPPVALAAYAGAGISGADPMRTSVTAFKFGLAAFIVPFMFFYSPALLMQAEWPVIVRVTITGMIGVYLLAAAVQGWFFGRSNLLARAVLLVAALCMISGGWKTDAAGIGIAVLLALWQGGGFRRERSA